MADLIVEIDRLVREHAERCEACYGALPADSPEACSVCRKTYVGPAVPVDCLSDAAVERRRLAERGARADAASGTRVTWVPQLADPEHPTTTELAAGTDLTVFLARPPVEPVTINGFIDDEAAHAHLVETLRSGRIVIAPPPRPPWWRRIWRRRG